ncbi:MAG: YaiI/YqxD family protein [Spirochaetes bacterium]|nr:YaiI/YqxD family protein [Spirochaetota bacterium]
MTIYVDADACPTAIRDILLRAAERKKISIIFVANSALKLPESVFVSMRVVEKGPDIADDWIAINAAKGDLVISEDIPLADRVIEHGAVVLSTRGVFLDKANIKARLATRDLLSDLRDSGVETGGPPPFDQRTVRNFANGLDRFLQKNG